MSKVRFDLSQNTFSLLLAKGGFKPLFCIAVVLALIATILTVTQGNNVIGGSSAALAQSYPVIGSSLVEKPVQWTFANSATMVEVIEAVFPFGYSEIVGQIALTSATLVMVNLDLMAIGLSVVVVVVLNMPLIFLSPITKVRKHRIAMLASITRRCPSSDFRVANTGHPRMLFRLFRVVVVPILFLFVVAHLAMVLKPIRRTLFSKEVFRRGGFKCFANTALLHTVFVIGGLLSNKVYLARLPEIGVPVPAILAAGIQTVAGLLGSIEKLRSSGFPFVAIGTLFSGSHTSSTQDNLHLWCGRAGVEVSPVRAVNYSTLVHVPYYSMNGGRA